MRGSGEALLSSAHSLKRLLRACRDLAREVERLGGDWREADYLHSQSGARPVAAHARRRAAPLRAAFAGALGNLPAPAAAAIEPSAWRIFGAAAN